MRRVRSKPVFLAPNRIITSSLTGTRYKVGEVIGEGGFGRAYRAYELNRRSREVEEVCLKTTLDQASWHRESYFGELFRHNRRVLRMYDSFPMALSARGDMMYCLVLELAEAGNIAEHFERTPKPWAAARARREIAALLKALDQLHAGGATHRDLTPMNVFVCGRGVLKLGDFGIARHEVAGRLITIDAFNPQFVSRGFAVQEHRRWVASDDVFQMGQLLAMMLRGDAHTLVTPSMLNQIDCSDDLKQVIKRAIGPRSKRYADAYEMRQAIEGHNTNGIASIKSLVGKTVTFSGSLSIGHFDAEIMVLQAGGSVTREVTRKVDVLVQGGRAPQQKNGCLTAKLRHAKKLIERGQHIQIIGEREFRRLVRKTSPTT